MPLWLKDDTSESAKPKWLSDEEKRFTYATNRGWVYRKPRQIEGRDGIEEVLVHIAGLAEKLGAPTIDAVSFEDTVLEGDPMVLQVKYNEPVIVSTVIEVEEEEEEGTATISIPATASTSGAISFEFSSEDSDPDTGFLVFIADSTGLGGETVTISENAEIDLDGGSIIDKTDGVSEAELSLNIDDDIVITVTEEPEEEEESEEEETEEEE